MHIFGNGNTYNENESADKLCAIYCADEETGFYYKFTERISEVVTRSGNGETDPIKGKETGGDFFAEMLNYGEHCIAPKDQDNFFRTFMSDKVLQQLGSEENPSSGSVFSATYGTIVDDTVCYCEYSIAREMYCGRRYIIVAIYDIDDEYRRRLCRQEELRAVLDQLAAASWLSQRPDLLEQTSVQEPQLTSAAEYIDIMTESFDGGDVPDSGDPASCASGRCMENRAEVSMNLRLQDLTEEADLTIRIMWEHEIMELPSRLVRTDAKGIYIKPYLHDDMPMRLNLSPAENVRCSLFAESYSMNMRVVWHDVEIETVDERESAGNPDNGMQETRRSGDGILYFVSTNLFNRYSRPGDRRLFERSPINLSARVIDKNGRCANATLGDISAAGLSFFADNADGKFSFEPDDDATVSFVGTVDGDVFNVSMDIKIVRSFSEGGITYCGCRIPEPPDDYKLYVFLYSLNNARQK